MKDREKAGKGSKSLLVVVFAVILVLLLLNVYLIGGIEPFWLTDSADRNTGGETVVTDSDPPAGAPITEGQMGVTPLPDEIAPSGPVKVTTPEYELTYSETMADIVRVEQTKGENGTDLAFYATLSENEVLIFTMHYNVSEGGFIHKVMNNSLGEVPFCFVMAEAPEGLGDADQYTFYASQEIINDIMQSLALRQNE